MTPQSPSIPGPAIPGQTSTSLIDPVIAALLASGAPVQLPPQPVISDPLATGPITSPNELPPVQPPILPPEAPVVPVEPTAPQPPVVVRPRTLGELPFVDLAQPTAPPVRSGDVQGTTAAQNLAVDTEARNIAATELAKTGALAAHAATRASIYEGHATAQGLVDQQYQTAREAARNDSNAEAAAWQRDLDRKVAEEPAPGRWFANQSGFSKVMYVLSLAFGSMAQARNGNLKNIGLELITAEIAADVAAQRDKLKREVEALNKRGARIDQRTAERLADARDDHAMLGARLAVIQQAAMERANAPGPRDQQAAMLEAAQWAGQQRLAIAGQRADRAYAEREGKLNRDAENARALLTDRRTRDISAAEIQKDYDLARITASSRPGLGEAKLQDTRTLNPDITGIRVVDSKTGQPAVTALSPTGGLVVSKGVEKEAIQDAQLAQDRYATLKRVSSELGKDEDLNALLKRNPQLISDIVKLGYQTSKENDPRGVVTDRDFSNNLESALGGDLNSLAGRVAAGTFAAGQGNMKKLVDKALRDLPAKVSNRLGALVDAGIPGYEGNVRVDWTPKSVEIDEPKAPTTRQIDASYGIQTPLKSPQNLEQLKEAQDLEKRGVEALPPYRPGSQDKVIKALEDFKGATPDKIEARAREITDQLYDAGDQRAVLEVMQAKIAETKKAGKRLKDLEAAIKFGEDDGLVRSALEKAGGRTEVNLGEAAQLAKKYGLGQMTGDEILDLIKRVGVKPATE